MTPFTGGMAYVALERMLVSIAGRTGSFLLRHSATMQQNDAAGGKLDIAVVPNSGTGALAGIAGTLQIVMSGKEHHYTFDYTLPAPQPNQP